MTSPLHDCIFTRGVMYKPEFQDHIGDLWVAVVEQWKKEPKVCTDGGNDQDFFSFKFKGIKLFSARNEKGGLTTMLPEEY